MDLSSGFPILTLVWGYFYSGYKYQLDEREFVKPMVWRSQTLHSQLLHEFVMQEWQNYKGEACAFCVTDLAQISSLLGPSGICHAKQLDCVDSDWNFAWQIM